MSHLDHNPPLFAHRRHRPLTGAIAFLIVVSALSGLRPLLRGAGAETGEKLALTDLDVRQRFVSLLAGIWESVPPAAGSPRAVYHELHADGTGATVIRLKLSRSENLIVSRINWTVESGAKVGEFVLRLRYVRSTEANLVPGTTTESTILEVDKLGLKTQTLRGEVQSFVHREQLPPEIAAAIAQFSLIGAAPPAGSADAKR